MPIRAAEEKKQNKKNLIGTLLHQGEDGGHQRGALTGVIDELTHIVDNHAAATLGGFVLLVQTTPQDLLFCNVFVLYYHYRLFSSTINMEKK